jgi:hypothetical protein
VDIKIVNSKKVRLEGLCCVCEGKILRMGSLKKMADYEKNFLIQTQVNQHIVKCESSSLNSDI